MEIRGAQFHATEFIHRRAGPYLGAHDAVVGEHFGSMLRMRLPGKKWLEAKRKSWRKRHLGLDLVSGEIVCSDLTWDGIDDPTALPDLLDQVDGPVDLFLANVAYDGSSTRDLLADRFSARIEIAIPPPKNATLSLNAALHQTVRDRAIAQVKAHGRMVWQKTSGYNQRSRGETLMGRRKAVIGPKPACCMGQNMVAVAPFPK